VQYAKTGVINFRFCIFTNFPEYFILQRESNKKSTSTQSTISFILTCGN